MMNRRQFVNGTLAGIALTQFPAVLVASADESIRPVHWLENGLIDAGGSHEPYIFVVRRGGQPADSRESYEKQQSEAVIRRLKEQGIEVFHTHLYKGFGMAAEKPEMEDTVHAAEIAHRYGMRIDTYIQWNTMMYETFFAEEPRAKDWIQRDSTGQPILLTYGYQQSFRYRPCFANQRYLDYLKKVVRYAVVEVKTDFIHFDNFDLNPEPDSCHCPACVQGFRSHLRAKYSSQQRKERFGFENTDFVNPPQWNLQNPPQRMEIIFDPALQEWIDFRCQLMADALKQMALYAKSLNPEVVIEINPHGITGANRAWESGIDHARILKWTEAFWTEEDNPPGYSADARLISRIRSFKLARTYKNILLVSPNDALDVAESLAFNQTIGFAGVDPIPPAICEYVVFYRKYRDLFLATQDVALVAVLRSYPSITYHNMRAQLEAVLVEQALIQTRIPFDLVFDEHLADLSKYKVLILPNSECLSDAQLALIRNFVERGGGLVVTGASGLYDEWRRLRVQPGLCGLVEGQSTGESYVESVRPGGTAVSGSPTRREYGRGRVIYVPEVQFDGVLPTAEPYFEINNRYWKLPANWKAITDGVRWAGRDPMPLEVSGPPSLVANLVSQPAKNRLLLHLINYDARNTASIRSIEIRCALPRGVSAREVSIYSPDFDGPRVLSSIAQADEASFVVPEVKTYSAVCISW